MVNLCNGCDLCCRKYKIYLFPNEAKAIANLLKINYKEFVKKYLDFYIELFPYINSNSDYFVMEYNNKKYFAFITLALKQKDGCIFLKNKACSIYVKRPLICKLFPDFKFYDEQFDFCKLDKLNKKTEDPRKFYPFLAKYLKDIKHNGFEKTWKYFPELNEKNIYFVLDGKKEAINSNILAICETIL